MAEKTEKIDKVDSDGSRSPEAPVRPYFPPSQRKIHDNDVTFEEYYFYAQQTREEQRLLPAPQWQWRSLFSSKGSKEQDPQAADGKHEPRERHGSVITDEEWSNASRSFRTASWGAIFYLVSSLL